MATPEWSLSVSSMTFACEGANKGRVFGYTTEVGY